MTHPILIKWPSRSRPNLMVLLWDKWAVPGVHVLVTLDADDPALPHYWDFLDGKPNVTVRVGHSKGKVEAINDGVAEADWEFLILAADDFVPQRPDYATFLRDALFDAIPDGDGVVWPNDGRTGRVLNTTAIMGRKYFDRTGRIYESAYRSLFCDDEFTAVSRALNRVVYVEEVVLKHEWTNLTGRDPLHVRNESFYDADGKVFRARRAAGFPVRHEVTA